MIKLKVRDTYYKVIDSYYVKKSSREVKFSNVIVDFTNKTILDLPLRYQEVQLVEIDDNNNINEIIYTGYVNTFVLPKMKNRVEYRELELELLSPLAIATIRTIDAIGTYKLQNLVQEIINPLIDDGFTLKEFNIGNNQITVNYLTETVESALNKLSNKFSFWWYIDENKNIYINDIDSLLAKTQKIIYDDNNPINGLIDIIPSIDANNYCNTINFTNLRLYVNSQITRSEYEDPNTSQTIYYYVTENPIFTKYELSQGDEITFDIPFDITISNYIKNYDVQHNNFDMFDAMFYDSNNNLITAYIKYENDVFSISSNISIEDSFSENNTFVFVRDPFFKNLLTGFKYNGTSNITLENLAVANALMWTKIRVINNDEVYRSKGIISDTGIVEKQINMNAQWKTYDEIIDIADSYIKENTSKVEQVVLNVDENINVGVGDIIKINKPSFLVNDKYIITDLKITSNCNITTWQMILRNTNILESYIDLFRASNEETTEEKTYNLITSDYSEDKMREVYEVVEL